MPNIPPQNDDKVFWVPSGTSERLRKMFPKDRAARDVAFTWLMDKATGHPTQEINGHCVERGQLLTTTFDLAKAWRWREREVRRFLDDLVTEKLIRFETQKQGGRYVSTIITLLIETAYYDSTDGTTIPINHGAIK
jgi:hypothetical protein